MVGGGLGWVSGGFDASRGRSVSETGAGLQDGIVPYASTVVVGVGRV